MDVITFGLLYGLSPGLVGALASGLFVKPTWTTRAVGFVVGEVAIMGTLMFGFCTISGANGKTLSQCAVDVPVGLVGALFAAPKKRGITSQ